MAKTGQAQQLSAQVCCIELKTKNQSAVQVLTPISRWPNRLADMIVYEELNF